MQHVSPLVRIRTGDYTRACTPLLECRRNRLEAISLVYIFKVWRANLLAIVHIC
jgi:hypothetical protein